MGILHAPGFRIEYEPFKTSVGDSEHVLDFKVILDESSGVPHDEGTVYACGFLKWDGCVNIDFDAGKDCMLHFCGPEDDPFLGRMMKAIYALGPQIPAWDH